MYYQCIACADSIVTNVAEDCKTVSHAGSDRVFIASGCAEFKYDVRFLMGSTKRCINQLKYSRYTGNCCCWIHFRG